MFTQTFSHEQERQKVNFLVEYCFIEFGLARQLQLWGTLKKSDSQISINWQAMQFTNHSSRRRVTKQVKREKDYRHGRNWDWLFYQKKEFEVI